MIVSKGLGEFVLATPRRKRNFKAVQRSVPGSDIVSAVPPQVPTFNISKHIAKPFLYNAEFTPKKNVVPLKYMQEGSHAPGASLFNAPVFLIPEPLRQPIPVARNLYSEMHSLMEELENVSFDVPFNYNAGIRPGVRQLKGDHVEEPDAPFPTRTGRAGQAKERYGTYRVGAQEYNILGL